MGGPSIGLARQCFLNDHFGEKNYSARTLEFILWVVNGAHFHLF